MIYAWQSISLMGTNSSKELDTSEPIQFDGTTLDLRRRIGHGGFSVVYKGKFRDRVCAVKIRKIRTVFNSFRSKSLNDDLVGVDLQNFEPPSIREDYIMNELKWLQRLEKSSFVLRLVKCFNYEGRSFMITEFIRFTFVQALAFFPEDFFEEAFFHLFTPVLFTLRYMHRSGLVHRDLKPANLLLSKEGIPKLCDFEHCTRLSKEKRKYDPMLALKGGTPYLVAPEHIRREMCDTRVDAFALGLTLLASFSQIESVSLLYGEIPFSDIAVGFDPLLKRKEWVENPVILQAREELGKSLNTSKERGGSRWNNFCEEYLEGMIELDQAKRVRVDKVCEFEGLEGTYEDWRRTLTYCEKPPSLAFGETHSKILEILRENKPKVNLPEETEEREENS